MTEPECVEKNALAKLAKQLNSPVEIMPGTGNSLIGLNREQLEAYKKSLRIVAELAKVRISSIGGAVR